MEGFIEKATQTLARKFSARNPQAVFVGALHPTSPDRYYRSLASNLRGRLLQVLPKLPVTEVEEQEPERETLFCLVGKEGLFAGMQSPLKCNGFYPGGSKFIDQDAPEVISRAGAKLAEALHYLRLHRAIPPPGSHWIELGASPGGMTSELLARAQRVTAIDRAPLDQRLAGRAGLTAVLADVATFQPAPGTLYDAILNDMNGPPEESIAQVIRLARYLTPRGLVIFTLKLPRIENMSDACGLFRKTVKTARAAGLHLIAQTHLTYNRHEFTLFLERSGSFS
jgi:23S rRNA C2498 (ribose-2'-O)-methylase RlmM